MTDEQFAKLPRRAQSEILRLRGEVQSAEQRLAMTLRPADEKHPAYGDYDEQRGMSLPCRTVWFPSYGIEVRVGRDGVEIHGDGRLSILPHVTNVVTVVSDHVDR